MCLLRVEEEKKNRGESEIMAENFLKMMNGINFY